METSALVHRGERLVKKRDVVHVVQAAGLVVKQQDGKEAGVEL